MIRAATCGLVALAVLASGCSARSAASPAGSQRPVTGSHGSASQRNTSPVGVTTRSQPGCTTAVQQARSLAAADVAAEKVPGRPFGVAVTANGRWAFVSLGPTVGVFRIGSSALPLLVRRIQKSAGVMLGNGLSPDNRYLLAANGGTGAAVLSAPLAEHGGQGAILGTLSARGGSPGGAIEAAVSPDGRYAFVSLEYAFEIAVFSLRRVQSGGVGQAAYVGSVPAQLAPVGLALSPEGRWLYSTSEAEGPATNVGSLTVIDVAKAETDPAHSTVARVPAGCNPVRVVTSADGSVVWVTARASDAVLAFSPANCGPTRRMPCWPMCGSVSCQWAWRWSEAAPGSWSRTPTGSASAARPPAWR